ncbi:MAG: MBOAT family protein [Halobacteriovoraceae bacterium]|nr:MBOAT family protein [Halobacteriovoraceae bacterium]
MLFNSIVFLFFLAVFFGLWPILGKKNNSRWVFITLASFVFYGWWDWRFIGLIIFSGLIDYFAGLAIEKNPSQSKKYLLLSLGVNLGTLVAFKYSLFFAENLNFVFNIFGSTIDFKNSIPLFFQILPVGISFYTFQSMSYTIDIYRGELKPTKNIWHFFSYLSMFPQLVAGPIVRAKDLLPQLLSKNKTTEKIRWEGTRLIVHGFFKKMVIADNLAPIVNESFNSPELNTSSLVWWTVMISFAYQIYCDFSGYSDIARGLAKWMGYEFNLNFNYPYRSRSFKEFWQRWHISLSSWFRDYVYIPLGGSQTHSKLRKDFNMWTTMLLSGLWHGAAWNFIIWGALHAFYLQFERLTSYPHKLKKNFLTKLLLHIFILVQVLVAWVFFRAHSAGQALEILGMMFSFSGRLTTTLGNNGSIVLLIVIAREFFCYFAKDRTLASYVKNKFLSNVLEVAIVILMVVLTVFFRGPGSEFIYFQF